MQFIFQINCFLIARRSYPASCLADGIRYLLCIYKQIHFYWEITIHTYTVWNSKSTSIVSKSKMNGERCSNFAMLHMLSFVSHQIGSDFH